MPNFEQEDFKNDLLYPDMVSGFLSGCFELNEKPSQSGHFGGIFGGKKPGQPA